MRQIYATLALLFFCTVGIGQQKKSINSSTYDEWKTIRSVTQSASGALVVYDVAPLEGDAQLVIDLTKDNKKRSFDRGKGAKISANESVVVFMVEPYADSIRKLKLDEASKDKFPKDSLFVYFVQTDSVKTFANVKSFQLSETSSTVVFSYTKDTRPDCPANPTKKQKKKNPCTKSPTSGQTLAIYQPESGEIKEIFCVTNFWLSKDGRTLLYTTSNKGTKDTLTLMRYVINEGTQTILLEKQLGLTQLTFDEQSNQFAFLATTDTNKLKNYSLYYSRSKSDQPRLVVDSLTTGMPADFTVSENGNVYFNQSGSQLFFGIDDIVRQEPKDTLLDTEKVRVDVWGTNDARIQPQQLYELQRDKKKTFLAVYYPQTNKMIQLGSDELPDVYPNTKSSSTICLGIDDRTYLRENTWEYPWKSDYYLVDMETGSRQLIKQGQAFRASLSPSGKYFVFYNGLDSSWNAIAVQTKVTANLSKHTGDIFAGDNNGNPSLAEEQGYIGWTLLNGEEYVLVNSRNHIWALHPEQNQKSFMLTGLQNNESSAMRYEYYRMDHDSLYTLIEQSFIIGIHHETKSQTIFQAANENGSFHLHPLLESNHKIVLIQKAEQSDDIILRRMSFTDYPDLEKTDVTFRSIEKISNINPQQSEYNWGTVEQVSWKSFKGIELDGLLYKPEDFDSTKSYPMIVYFYEKYSDDLHNYYAPKPTASIIHPTEYVSNGYIIFIPDVVYEPGYPANSAYDCIVSGTDYLTRRYTWIDSTRMGLQGQSWGGYQTAQLITMTTKYKAAMAGAPVSNMFSAYGGIRWGSGLSRMFQYEKTQSRIGYTIWDRPDLYISNSPVFGLPKVGTPLLIMCNDNDGAVPWYQGIELYMGLRRLNKPVWMLNYNGDEHNLMKQANRRDLSVRMMQFFDYYLKGAPAPVWMSEGIPAIEKGKNLGYELEKSHD